MKNSKVNMNQVKRNVFVSVLAQIISLIVSFVLNMIVPKFVSELDYAYWQSFILYANYVGILHFGLIDGIVLRYAQFDYEELDEELFRSQLFILLTFDTIVSTILCLVCFAVLDGPYFWVGVFVAIAIISKNAIKYATYTLQITNRINAYALTTIIQRLVYGVFVVTALVLNYRNFYVICVGELLGEIVAFVWTFRYNTRIYVGHSVSLKNAIKEAGKNISVGAFLLVSNWSAMFLVGVTKMIIQWHWDELVFGKVSFAFSATSLFLTFVSAISVVLFPALKRMKQEDLPGLYDKIRSVLSPMLVFVLICYFPGAWVLNQWLPKYSRGVVYLGVLLPIIVYRSKVNLLTNNYLKAYRKEKTLLIVNLGSVALSIASGSFFAYVLDNLDMVLLFTVVTTIVMSATAEYFVCRVIELNFLKENIIEIVVIIVFLLCTRYLNLFMGFGIYLAALVIYFVIIHKDFVKNLKLVMR